MVKNPNELKEKLIEITHKHSYDIIWQMDAEYKLTYVSPSVFSVLGYKPEELTGKTIFEYLHSSDIKKAKKNIQALGISENKMLFEYKIFRKNKSLIHAEISSSSIRNNQGKVIGFSGVLRDISEKNKIREALRQSEKLFHQIVEHSHDIFYSQNINTQNIEYISPKVYDILGYTPDALVKMNLEEQKAIIHPDDLPGIIHFADDLVQADERGEYFIERVFRVLSKSGKYIWIEGYYSLIRDSEKKAQLIVGSLRDISQRKYWEEKLAESEEKLRLTIDNLTGFVYRCKNDKHWTMEYLSKGVTEICEYNKEDLIENKKVSYNEIIHPDDREYVFEEIQKAIRKKKQFCLEYRIISKSGKIKWLYEQGKGSENSLKHNILEGYVSDISHLKKTETQLRESELKFRSLADSAKVMISIISTEKNKYLYMNKHWEEVSEYPASDMPRLNPFDLVHPTDRKMISEYAEKRRNGEPSPERYELKIISKTGKVRILDFSSTIIFYENQSAYLTTGIDITEKKEEEKKLKETKKNLSFLSKASLELLQCNTIDEIYRYTAAKIYELLERSVIITIVDFDTQNNRWKMRTIQGLNKTIRKLTTILGFNPEKMNGKMVPDYHETLIEGKLVEFPLNIHKLSNGNIIKSVGDKVKRMLGMQTIHCICFKRNNSIFGNLSILSTKKTPKLNTELIVSLITQVSVFIEKIIVTQNKIENEQKYNSLINNSPESILIVKNKRIVFSNPAIIKISGFAHDTLEGKEFSTFIYPDDRKMVIENNRRRMSGENIKPYEFRTANSNGKYTWVRLTAAMIEWEGDDAILCFLSDIHEEKTAKETLRESEEKYRKLFQESGDPVLIIHEEKIVQCNKATIEFMGYGSEAKLTGKALWEISPKTQFDGQDSKLKSAKILNTCIEKGNIRTEWILLNKQKQEKWLDLSLSLIQANKKNHIHLICRDISELKKQEKTDKVLYKISHSVNTSTDLRHLAENIQMLLSEIFDTRNFTLCTYNPENHELPFIYKKNQKDKYQKFSLAKTLTNYVIKTGKSLFADQATQKELISKGDVVLIGHPAKIWLGIPLKIENKVIGIITLQNYENKEAYTINDFKLLEQLSNYIAVAIRKQETEDELRRKNTFIQTVLDNLPIGVALNNMNSEEATYINRQFEKIYGWPAAELKNIAVFFEKVYPDPMYREKLQKRVMEDINSGNPERMHWENLVATGKSGDTRRINATNIPLQEQNIMVSTVVDITKEKMNEERLLERTNAIEASSIGIAILDDNEKYTYLNQAHASIYAYNSPEELLGKTWKILYAKEELQLFKTKIMPEFKKMGHWQGRATGLKKNGSIFPQQLSLTALENGGLICVVSDISAQIETENELKHHKENLEQLVTERTRELKEKNNEMEKMNKLFVGREFRIKELKNKIKELEKKIKAYGTGGVV